LSQADAQTQAQEWVDLRKLASHVGPVAGGARMRFPMAHREGVLDLATRESACCSFLGIVTSVDGDELVLEITADTADAIEVIGLLAGFEPS
jgi:hypothetical protein